MVLENEVWSSSQNPLVLYLIVSGWIRYKQTQYGFSMSLLYLQQAINLLQTLIVCFLLGLFRLFFTGCCAEDIEVV